MNLHCAVFWPPPGFGSWREFSFPEKQRQTENRFLFVIDTASAMKSRSNGVEEAVAGLLKSGMNGQLRKGDTIGVWTYSDRLNTDFPMQVWSEQKKKDIVNEVRDHLRDLRYEKRAHLERALPEINKIVTHSERVTVILVFDGSDLIKGTPFDKDINALHKQYVREFKAAQAPFVTILAARHGAVFDYTINYPETVVVPLTADPLPPETNAPPPLAASTPPPVISNPPAKSPPPQRIQITLIGSNSTHHASAPPPAESNVVAVVTPAPVLLPANPPPPAVAVPVVVQAGHAKAALPEPAPPPSAASTPPPAPGGATPANPAPVAPPPARAAAVAVIPAVVPASAGQQAAMFVIAFSLLTIAVVLVLFLVRRSRGGSRPSLISQSIDHSR
jgi:hypothetical protein